MKSFDQLVKDKSLQIWDERPPDGCCGFVKLGSLSFKFQASWGFDWDHVSVSRENRCPSWEEMCKAKDIFFNDHETVIQYHPAKSKYVNNHPFCLHLWRPQVDRIPIPLPMMV